MVYDIGHKIVALFIVQHGIQNLKESRNVSGKCVFTTCLFNTS